MVIIPKYWNISSVDIDLEEELEEFKGAFEQEIFYKYDENNICSFQNFGYFKIDSHA